MHISLGISGGVLKATEVLDCGECLKEDPVVRLTDCNRHHQCFIVLEWCVWDLCKRPGKRGPQGPAYRARGTARYESKQKLEGGW